MSRLLLGVFLFGVACETTSATEGEEVSCTSDRTLLATATRSKKVYEEKEDIVSATSASLSEGTCRRWVAVKNLFKLACEDWEIDTEKSGDCDSAMTGDGFCECSENEIASMRVAYNPDRLPKKDKILKNCREACTLQEKSRYQVMKMGVECPPGSEIKDWKKCMEAVNDLGFVADRSSAYGSFNYVRYQSCDWLGCSVSRRGPFPYGNGPVRFAESPAPERCKNKSDSFKEYLNICDSPPVIPQVPFCSKPSTYFQLKSKESSKHCLDLDVKSNNVIVWECHDGNNQKWTWDEGRLKSKENKLCVTIGNANKESVKATECGSSANQMIKAEGEAVGLRTGKQCDDDGKAESCCLDWDHHDAHNVIAWGCHTGANQKWIQS